MASIHIPTSPIAIPDTSEISSPDDKPYLYVGHHEANRVLDDTNHVLQDAQEIGVCAQCHITPHQMLTECDSMTFSLRLYLHRISIIEYSNCFRWNLPRSRKLPRIQSSRPLAAYQ